jgi:hypothetical protein
MRSVWLVCLLASGCYDVDALGRSSTSDGGGARDGAGGGGGGGGIDNWESISPPASATSFALRGVFGSGGDVVAVGASSTIVRLASAPGAESAPPGYNLRAVWLGAGGAFAVGDSETVLMRGGSAWNGASLGDLTLYAVTGLPGGGAIAVGSGGAIVHQETTTWVPDEEMPTVNVALFGVAARAAGDVIAVGEAGTVVHGTGSAPPLTWTAESSGVIGDLHAVWTTATETWIVGAGGVVLHAGTDDAWAPEASGTGADLFGISGDADSVWAVGAGGTIVRRHAGAWSVEAAGGATLRAVFAAGNGEAWAVGDDGAIWHRRP